MKLGQTIEENLQQKLRSYERPLPTRRDLELQLMFMVATEILIFDTVCYQNREYKEQNSVYYVLFHCYFTEL